MAWKSALLITAIMVCAVGGAVPMYIDMNDNMQTLQEKGVDDVHDPDTPEDATIPEEAVSPETTNEPTPQIPESAFHETIEQGVPSTTPPATVVIEYVGDTPTNENPENNP